MSRDVWLRALRGGAPDDALEAARSLGASADPTVVGALCQALRSPSAPLRGAVCEALGELGDARAVGPLVSLLRDADDDVRGEAFSALLAIARARAGQLPPDAFVGQDLSAPTEALTQIAWPTDLEALGLLQNAVQDDDPEVRIGAAYTLGRLGVLSSFEAVAELLLHDPDLDVRAAAAFSLADLGERGAVGAVDVLVTAWQGTSTPDEVAVALVRALVEVAEPRAFRVLVDALKHPDARVRQLGAMGLGRLGDQSAVPRLIKALADAHVGVRRCVAAALGQLADPMSLKPLIAAVHGDDAEVRATVGDALEHFDRALVHTHLAESMRMPEVGLREGATYLMGRLRDDAGLQRALKDPEALVRKAAALAMGNVASVGYRPALEGALSDEAWQVRVAAAEGLRRLGDHDAVPALLRAAEDPHRVVRNAVGVALKVLGTTHDS
ncbi:MAG: HEAT repeat domain-containing protein [Bradymonadia bacterium]